MHGDTQPEFRILVFGAGLVAEMTTAALLTEVGAACDIIRVSPATPPPDDVLFGGVASPTAYEFMRSLGVSEPQLFLNTPTTFSYGAQFIDWPAAGRGWIQSYQQPLMPLQGVSFHQYVISQNIGLEPFLISAQAARAGKFAHPPEDDRHPLSRAEYGYHFCEKALAELLAAQNNKKIKTQTCNATPQLICNEQKIESVILDNGETISADLFIDCSGASRSIISALRPSYGAGPALCAVVSQTPTTEVGPPCRTIRSQTFGWQANLPLQNAQTTLRVAVAEQMDEIAQDGETLKFDPGRLRDAWVGNCVALGHAAAIFEPLSPAPMIILEKALSRLVKLIPNSAEMSIERREFNRLFSNDADNAEMFHRALFDVSTAFDTPYWRSHRQAPITDALARKLRQFESRGILVQYDHEPFTPEDWAVMHFGIGRRPARFDLQVRRATPQQIDRVLTEIQNAITQTVAKMPPHGVYLAKFKDYLKKNYND